MIPHIEALIFASDKPLTPAELTDLINQAFGFMEDKIVPGQVDAAIEGIVEKYASEFYPFEVKQSGGGWQFLTKRDFHKTVAQLNGEKFLKRLSAAALETLAIVAYKQPVTKGEIEAIRGVSSDYAVQKLLEKELVVITGRNEKLPGHPLVYATSKNFMDYFGINSAEDLPRIREVLAEQVIPTQIGEESERIADLGDDAGVADGGGMVEETNGMDEMDGEDVDVVDVEILGDVIEEKRVNGRRFGGMEEVEEENEVEEDVEGEIEEGEVEDDQYVRKEESSEEENVGDEEKIESGDVEDEDEGDEEIADEEEGIGSDDEEEEEIGGEVEGGEVEDRDEEDGSGDEEGKEE